MAAGSLDGPHVPRDPVLQKRAAADAEAAKAKQGIAEKKLDTALKKVSAGSKRLLLPHLLLLSPRYV